MPLVDVDVSIDETTVPADVEAFLREADARVTAFVNDSAIRITGFVPSGFATVYRALRAISESNLVTGNSFCEWGSGFGVVASLASMLGFRGCGIEIERDLVDCSRQLASDFGVSVEFIHGSFIPCCAKADAEEALADHNSEYFWLDTDADGVYDELGIDLSDFDIVFAYPSPGQG